MAVPVPAGVTATIAGSTRTIRRSDIEEAARPIAQKETKQIVKRSPTVEVAAPPTKRTVQVDMQGGESVMRKEAAPQQTPPVSGSRFTTPRKGNTAMVAPPPVATPNRVAPPPPVQRGAPPRVGAPGRPAPRSMSPGGQLQVSAPKKKSNGLMIGGIIGGVVLVGAIIGIVVMSPKGGAPATNNSTADGTKSNSGGPKLEGDKALLAQLDREINEKSSLPIAQVRANFQECKKRKDNPDFKTRLSVWSEELRKRALKDGGAADVYDIAVNELEPEGVNVSELIARAFKELDAGESVTVTTADGSQRRVFREDYRFADAAKRLGYVKYDTPDIFVRNYSQWGFPEYKTYEVELANIRADAKGDYIAPDKLGKLRELEGAVTKVGKALQDQHDKDGFAINARMAFNRFLDANRGGTRKERMFEPKVLGREGETVEECWTYAYYKPFIVLIEKSSSADDEETRRNIESKRNLLYQLWTWFDNNIRKPFKLQRQRPMGNGALAEREGWPMQLVVLKDGETFAEFVSRSNPGMAGLARAWYQRWDDRKIKDVDDPPEDTVLPDMEMVLTYDEPSMRDPAKEWSNDSVLVHETFHMLSDFYGANPQTFADFLKAPNYTSILIQEGLTEFIAGFEKRGQGPDAQYTFCKQNHLRLAAFQGTYKTLKKKLLYRIQDLLRTPDYGAAIRIAYDRCDQLKIQWLKRIGSQFLGLYYESACQAAHFFSEYKDEAGNYPYREKWWKLVEMDYTGTLELTSRDPEPVFIKVKELFGIKDDSDWDKMNKQFVDFTMALTPEDVGEVLEPVVPDEGGEGGGGDDKDNNIPPYRPSEQRQSAILPAQSPGQDRQKAA
ncbi:MAG: hypothetical protein IT462_13425 [Planctomycetes bacterium]|nr:hypothetical protein [Planctomycetota bacterium]